MLNIKAEALKSSKDQEMKKDPQTLSKSFTRAKVSLRELPAEMTKLRPKARPRAQPKVRAVVPSLPPVQRRAPMPQRAALPRPAIEEEEYSYYSEYEYEYSYA